MAEIKSHQADAFVERPDPKFRTFLFFGPDAGLVSERADTLCGKLGVDLSDPFALTRLDADAAADTGRLADEAGTIGMFGSARLVRVSGTTRRNLAGSLKPVLDNPPQDCWIVIEAGDLKKDAALRRQVTRSGSGAAIACYPDNDAALSRLIDAELSTAGLTIDPDAKQLLRSRIGADRRASRNEIAKLALYCHGRQSVRAQDVLNLVGDTSLLAADDAVDSAISGDLPGLERILDRLFISGAAPDMVILAALRHFQTLQIVRHRMDKERKPAADVIAGLRLQLFFSRKNAFMTALGLWRGDAITRALARLDKAAFETRANPGLGRSLAGTALIAIAVEAAQARRRNAA
ncbi:MAG: DNA polymerase III subunit delta [Salaquimonas sp.]|jgi:DNA polymerase-3 subunit delta|nr:DNA polymerase III subunit delta [Salaquimonas sp.]